MREIERPNPNPKIVALMNFAIDEISARLYEKSEYSDWLAWASAWKSGRHSPGICVDVARRCFDDKENPLNQCLGQLAWGAKEACYSTPVSGWLAIRYIADAMVAFGIAFPDDGIAALMMPTIDMKVAQPTLNLAPPLA